ncbi:zinc ABC transporter substrate-binding protein [Brevibacterium sp. 50QC2O2]|uniref:metal ABC transporter solute-binding protein, Zn/Mn family n=1 Tax=Brevibacterium sp. 50QC2O2 TaxID=2968459 RepID=UPI00211CC6D0|nr:zinc ABC transporter substrate-binding protein [Brevibacterium sp. 50QC2O2]MCQ9387201.1 zinc ABC transporter substrate-binding protein [Brevibacterium sp. 50QC2O2]
MKASSSASIRLRKPARFAAIGALSASALLLAACGSAQAGSASGGSADSGKLTVVTSTNVYADIVKNVAGDDADITAVIDDPNKDPHDYEATSADQLKVSKADLVVENGGGYDAFMTSMIKAANVDPTVVDAVSVSGLPGSDGVGNEGHDHGDEGHDEDGHEHGDEHGEEGHEHGEFNEHVWYSVPTMVKVSDAVAKELGEKSPDNADAFTKNADAYKSKLQGLEDKAATVKKDHNGAKAAATEPVPLWLFGDMGLHNATSEDFLEAVEEGDDVPPLVLKSAQDQISKKQVKLLAYNTQASNSQADALKDSAEKSNVPVVDLRETMPADTDYVTWMGGNIDAIDKALG